MTLRLLGGLVVYLSTLYCGPRARTGRGRGRAGGGLYPELAALGIGDGASPGLVSMVGRQCALLPSYALARQELAARGIHLDIKVVHRLARLLGSQVLTTRTRALRRWRAGQLPAGTALAGKRVAAMIDGGRTRLRKVTRRQKGKGQGKTQRRRYQASWREPKLLIIFEIDAQGRQKAGTQAWIDGTFAGPDEALELLAFHLHRLGAASAELLVFSADGAPWIWDRLEWVRQRVGVAAGRCHHVLDWCHAVHNLSLALEALGLPAQERQRWYNKLRRWLRRGWCGWLLRALEKLGEEHNRPAGFEQPLAYLAKHAAAGHLSYDQFRRHGLPLGSGAVESAIRRVINLRLKAPGTMWLAENAEGALVLRAAAVTGRWEETLARVRAEMGRDRQLKWDWQAADLVAELKANQPVRPPTPQPAAAQGNPDQAA